MERCRLCGSMAEFFGGYCLRCEKIAADAQADLAREFEPRGNVV